MIISWMVLKQGWSLCFLIVRKGKYYTEEPNTRYQNSDTGVLLLWSRCICIWFFIILPPSPLWMISFLEQNQPQGCLSHSWENTCKYTSAGVRAFQWLLKQGVLRDASTVPDWQPQKSVLPSCRNRYSKDNSNTALFPHLWVGESLAIFSRYIS